MTMFLSGLRCWTLIGCKYWGGMVRSAWILTTEPFLLILFHIILRNRRQSVKHRHIELIAAFCLLAWGFGLLFSLLRLIFLSFYFSSLTVFSRVAFRQDPTELRNVGLQLADIHFTLTRVTNRHCMMIGRCSATGSGCVIYKCGRCVVIATHEDAVQPGACYNAVERLGDFLAEKGYWCVCQWTIVS